MKKAQMRKLFLLILSASLLLTLSCGSGGTSGGGGPSGGSSGGGSTGISPPVISNLVLQRTSGTIGYSPPQLITELMTFNYVNYSGIMGNFATVWWSGAQQTEYLPVQGSSVQGTSGTAALEVAVPGIAGLNVCVFIDNSYGKQSNTLCGAIN